MARSRALGPIWARPEPGSRRPRFTREQIASVALAIPDAELPDDWRAALAAIARRTRDVFLRHPWALHSLQGEAAVHGAPVGPNGLRHFEQSLAALEHAPLDTSQKLDLLAIVD